MEIVKGILEFGSVDKYINSLIKQIEKLQAINDKLTGNDRTQLNQEYDYNKTIYGSNTSLKYKNYKKRAIEAGYSMDLSIQDFEVLLSLQCYYCGLKGGTIDRLNSNEGYTYQNSKPCCLKCNIMKNNLSKEEFINHIVRIAEHNKVML